MTPGMCRSQGTLNPPNAPHRGICRQQRGLAPPGCSICICPQSPSHCRGMFLQPPSTGIAVTALLSRHVLSLPDSHRAHRVAWGFPGKPGQDGAVAFSQAALLHILLRLCHQEVEAWQAGPAQSRKGWCVEQVLGGAGKPRVWVLGLVLAPRPQHSSPAAGSRQAGAGFG